MAGAIALVESEVPDLATLWNLLPGLQNEVAARLTVMGAEHNISSLSTADERAQAHKIVAKAIPIAHSNVRVAEAAANPPKP